jgi:CPA2 family monovalent cation:H+ antiporter-2
MFKAAELAQRDGDGEPQRANDPLAELPATVPQESLHRHVVLVGHGRVGKRIAAALEEGKIPYVVVEQNRERVQAQRARGMAAVAGDAAEPGVLIQAHIARAAMLVVAAPDAFDVRRMIATARALNPQIASAVRSHGSAEADLLRGESADRVFTAEEELAASMARHVLERLQAAGFGG